MERVSVSAADKILGGYFPVLDHGFISLVDYMGTDEDIERAARVSYGAGTRKVSETRGLIRYLRRHKHTTPTEMVELKFHCSMPIFVARQWIRHRTASVNEYSGRYSLMPLIFYEPKKGQFQFQSKDNKQGREGNPLDEMYIEALKRWGEVRRRTARDYNWLVEGDIARELSRIDLPLSTYTQWYWKIDLHNLMGFLTLRCDSHAQWEFQQFANIMAGMLKRLVPHSYEAWIDYQLQAETMSRMEMKAIRRLIQPHREGGITKTVEGKVNVLAHELKEEFGMGKREIEDLEAKLVYRGHISHDLDLTEMLTGDEMEKVVKEAELTEFALLQ